MFFLPVKGFLFSNSKNPPQATQEIPDEQSRTFTAAKVVANVNPLSDKKG